MNALALPTLILTALASASPGPPSSPAFAVTVDLARPLELAGAGATRNVIRIGLRGLRPNEGPPRAPVNLALVLDRSGSMVGGRIARARQAARMVVERLGPDDILSLVTYDDDVHTLVPATRVGARGPFLEALEGVKAGGSTALFAGVSRGVAEVRRFLDPARVDRVVLLSDGQANLGPSQPSELGRLGAAAAKEGISITTIGLGLGYNEDLMARLAIESDGNHGFAESAEDLARFFDAELRDTLSVVAEQVEVHVALGAGVQVVRSLGRPMEVYPRRAVGRLVQLNADREKHFLVEVEVERGPAGTQGIEPKACPPPTCGADGAGRAIAVVEVRARRIADGRPILARADARLRYVRDAHAVQAAENDAVMVSAAEAVAVEQNRAALDLRDQGRLAEARKTLEANAAFLEEKAARYDSARLLDYSKENAADAERLHDEQDWKRLRKKMRSKQHKLETQQAY